MQVNELTEKIIGAAIAVHRELGPGLLESAYETCLAYELSARGLVYNRQLPLPVSYKGILLDCEYRLDLLVENSVIVELKAVDALSNLHEAQLLSYLKLSRVQVGLLINFNVQLLKQGIRRIITGSNPQNQISAIPATSVVNPAETPR